MKDSHWDNKDPDQGLASMHCDQGWQFAYKISFFLYPDQGLASMHFGQGYGSLLTKSVFSYILIRALHPCTLVKAMAVCLQISFFLYPDQGLASMHSDQGWQFAYKISFFLYPNQVLASMHSGQGYIAYKSAFHALWSRLYCLQISVFLYPDQGLTSMHSDQDYDSLLTKSAFSNTLIRVVHTGRELRCSYIKGDTVCICNSGRLSSIFIIILIFIVDKRIL